MSRYTFKQQKVIDAFFAKLNSFKFGYDTAGLPEYTEQEPLDFLTKSLFDSKTPEVVEVWTGIKHQQAINIMDDTIYLQTGGDCPTFTPTGDTVFTQAILEVSPITTAKSWCLDELNDFITQKLLPAGSYAEDVAPAELMDFIAGLIAQVMEVAYWQGNTASGNPNLNKFDGFIKTIDAAVGVIDGNTSNETSITTSNAISIFDNILLALPAALLNKEDVFVACGWDTFRKLIINLKNQNNSAGFHYDSTNSAAMDAGEMPILGTKIRIKALHGLDGTNRIFAGRKRSFYIGCDVENDPTNWQLWYDINTDLVKFRSKFKLGTQITFPTEIVQYTNA